MKITLIKRLLSTAILNPEKVIKFIIFAIILPLLITILLIFSPLILIVNLPSILLERGNSVDTKVVEKQTDIIEIYKDVPETINEKNLEWIEDKKKEYSWCDDIDVIYNFALTWQHLMAVDSIKLNQDFSMANEEDILNLGELFMKREAKVKTYKVKKTYTNSKGEKKTKWVTKHRAVIEVQTKSLKNILENLNFDDTQKSIATNIYNSIAE